MTDEDIVDLTITIRGEDITKEEVTVDKAVESINELMELLMDNKFDLVLEDDETLVISISVEKP